MHLYKETIQSNIQQSEREQPGTCTWVTTAHLFSAENTQTFVFWRMIESMLVCFSCRWTGSFKFSSKGYEAAENCLGIEGKQQVLFSSTLF